MEPASDALNLDRNWEWGCGAVRLCTLLAGWPKETEIVGESLENLPV